MSLKNLPYQNNTLTLQDFVSKGQLTIQEDVQVIKHQVHPITGEYTITDINNNNVLSVSSDGTLTNDSYIKTHIANQVNPVSSSLTQQTINLTTAQANVLALQTLTSEQAGLINGCVADIVTLQNTVPTDQNFTNMQTAITNIQTYITNLQTVFTNLSNTIVGIDFSSVV